MAEKVKHTETPWYTAEAYPNQVFAEDRHATALATCDYGSHDRRGYDDVDVANAELIVRACNAHDKLVAALKYAKTRLELADEGRFDKTTLPMINAALKAAGVA